VSLRALTLFLLTSGKAVRFFKKRKMGVKQRSSRLKYDEDLYARASWSLAFIKKKEKLLKD
jgi:hypothetical protein